MENLNDKQKKELKKILSSIEGNPYVIPRGHTNLPNKVTGDLDIITTVPYQISDILQEQGFKPARRSVLEKVVSIVRKGLENPVLATEILFRNPRKIIQILRNDNQNQFNRGLVDIKLENKGLMIHIKNSLSYKSTLDGSSIPADPLLVKNMVERRETVLKNEIKYYTPFKSDELLHLIGRGVFNYRGNFPQYYNRRCYELWETMSKEEKKEFQVLSEHLFFNASELVTDCLEKKQLENLKENLESFSNY